MGLTVTRSGDWLSSIGNRQRTKVTVAFDSSYPTGGESFTAADAGLSSIETVHIQPTAGYVFSYDYAAAKIKVFVEEAVAAGGPLLEAADLLNLSTLTGVVVETIGI